MTTMTEQPAQTAPSTPAPSRTGRKVAWIVAAGVVALVVALLVHAGSGSGDDPLGKQVDSKRVCQNFVKDELKSPASAKFTSVASTGSGDAWTVAGNVDSDNSFGAPIRNSFSCSVTYDDATNEWTLTSMSGLAN